MTARSLLLAVSLMLVGCSYALVGTGSTLPEDVRTVYVEPLENRTQRAQLEQFLTRAIADELVTRRRFVLVSSAAEADAVLRGAVTAFRVTPITFDADGRGEEYEISITASMAFVRTDEDETALWANDRYQFRETYQLGGSTENFFDRENVTIRESAQQFAETMVVDLLQGF